MVIFWIIVIVFVIRFVIDTNKNASLLPYANALQKFRIKPTAGLIANNFIDSKHLFIKLNRELPNVLLINEVDVNKVTKLIEETVNTNMRAVYKHRQFDFNRKRPLFNMIIMVTHDKNIIEIGNGYVELLYTPRHVMWADKLAQDIAQHRIEKETKVLTRDICVTGFAGSIN